MSPEKHPKTLKMIFNYPDDLERKVQEIFICEARKEFDFFKMIISGIPAADKLIKFGAVVVRPLENDVDFSINTKSSRSGDYYVINTDFTVIKQDALDYKSIANFKNKHVILILKTSTNEFCLGSTDEPMKLTFKEDVKKLNISLFGEQIFEPIRKY